MRMKSLGLALTMCGMMCGIMTATAASAQPAAQGSSQDAVPTGKGGWGLPALNVPPILLQKRGKPKPPPPPTANNGINYHNGPVMLGTVNMYYIWYGDWSGNSSAVILVSIASANANAVTTAKNGRRSATSTRAPGRRSRLVSMAPVRCFVESNSQGRRR